ncbi:MAG: glycerol-3-phosphate acyltransferase [Ignavibacterium sp.]|nr:glycerol-3-phosphate acyltransferase [Ignavibacterium sp.]
MDYFISSLLGYLFGSIPTAYIVLKKAKGIDVTKSGTGNVGAMNSYEVSGSKMLGILVFVVDFLKGVIPVLIILQLFGYKFSFAGLTLVFSIFAHCFNPWLNFKGGRGLATAAGGSLVLAPLLLIIWIIIWLVFYLIKKDILIANIFATILTLVTVMIGNNFYIEYSIITDKNVNELVMLSSVTLILVFIKHIGPLNEIIKKNNKNSND